MNDEITIGARLGALRRWRGMSQVELAGLAGVSQGFLSMVERGQRALDRRSHIAALAAALRVSETEIVGGPHLSADPVQSDPHNAVPALRAALETNMLDEPMCERARPLPDLVSEMGAIEPLRAEGNYVELGERLPSVLDELHLHIADPGDEAALRLALATLVEACVYASGAVRNLGYMDLGHLAALRATEAAAIIDDPVDKGKAAFMRVLTMPKVGSWDRALLAAEKAADRLQPQATTPLGVQVLGMLALNAALAAAAVNKGGAASTWLGHAQELAAQVPDAPGRNWQYFSTTNVCIWRIAIEVELGESGGAVLEDAEQVTEEKLAGVSIRKSMFLADVGRGLAREPKTRDQAVRWLRRAEDAAPQVIRNSTPVRHSLEVLREQALASAVSMELRGMMARMGIPH